MTMADRTRSRLVVPEDDEEDDEYHPYTLFIKEVLYSNGTQQEYTLMKTLDSKRHSTKSLMPFNINQSLTPYKDVPS